MIPISGIISVIREEWRFRLYKSYVIATLQSVPICIIMLIVILYRQLSYFPRRSECSNSLNRLHTMQDTIAAAGRWIMLVLLIVSASVALIYGYKGLLALSRWMDARDAASPRRRMPGSFCTALLVFKPGEIDCMGTCQWIHD